MEIIDAQLHELGPKLDWSELDQPSRYKLLTEVNLDWMDSAGIDVAVLNPIDEQWAAVAIEQHPARFAATFTISDPESADIDERIAGLRSLLGGIAARIVFGRTPADPR